MGRFALGEACLVSLGTRLPGSASNMAQWSPGPSTLHSGEQPPPLLQLEMNSTVVEQTEKRSAPKTSRESKRRTRNHGGGRGEHRSAVFHYHPPLPRLWNLLTAFSPNTGLHEVTTGPEGLLSNSSLDFKPEGAVRTSSSLQARAHSPGGACGWDPS